MLQVIVGLQPASKLLYFWLNVVHWLTWLIYRVDIACLKIVYNMQYKITPLRLRSWAVLAAPHCQGSQKEGEPNGSTFVSRNYFKPRDNEANETIKLTMVLIKITLAHDAIG